MTKRMTKKDYFTQLNTMVSMLEKTDTATFTINEYQALHDFINKEMNALSTKKSKPTKTQVENEDFKQAIIDYLTGVTTPQSISEMQENVDTLTALSNQRVSALLTQLCNAGIVTRVKDKKKTYFTLTK